MIWKEIVQDGTVKELFVFRNGELIYKRWITYGYGCIFDSYGPPFYCRSDQIERQINHNHFPFKKERVSP